MASTSERERERNIAVLEQARANFNDPATRERYFDLYDPHCTVHGYAGVEPGIASIRDFYAAFWTAFPDCTLHFDDLLAEAGRVACRFHVQATHLGPFNGIPATGKPVLIPGITILEFRDGRCVERWSQADFLAVLQQIGALPGPGG